MHKSLIHMFHTCNTGVIFYTLHVRNYMCNTIEICTCDEGNMEFNGSGGTIFTEMKPGSILVPKINKTHTA